MTVRQTGQVSLRSNEVQHNAPHASICRNVQQTNPCTLRIGMENGIRETAVQRHQVPGGHLPGWGGADTFIWVPTSPEFGIERRCIAACSASEPGKENVLWHSLGKALDTHFRSLALQKRVPCAPGGELCVPV